MANGWVSLHVRWFVELVRGSPYSCIMTCITSGRPSNEGVFFLLFYYIRHTILVPSQLVSECVNTYIAMYFCCSP